MSWAKAALAAMYPRTREIGLGAADLDLDGFLKSMFVGVPFEPALAMRVAIWIVALAPLFAIGRFTTISTLSEIDRERVVARLLTSPLYAVRQLVLGLKAVGAMLYAAVPLVRERMLGTDRARPTELAPREGALLSLGLPRSRADEGVRRGTRPAA
jgi:hypothetical protein